ncbi:5-dehydro-2-deoxygluconokinase [Fodinicurvata sp. EGI_FJ10296]|uniref:bifunctional 5-dehydro-2-deoxygluconokinase/5-dehydro-2- deoxyphosphogluconate aldolase n=1 Tax=Fodinicurvata sp. EGI_FJ10296 TaxID=3231908 RepID=UPI00345325C0
MEFLFHIAMREEQAQNRTGRTGPGERPNKTQAETRMTAPAPTKAHKPGPNATRPGEDALDVVTVGRSSIDLYGDQVGGRLEDMASFAKYIGGCPANIAIGTSRLGLKSAVVTGVGDEHMGRFIREELAREGVDISGVKTDPDRLTALVILGIRNQHSFPLIFFRENCADAALTPDDIDPALIARAGAVVVTGTHFSTPGLDAMSRRAMTLARENEARVILDIDYRPVLWGAAGHGQGESRFVADEAVSAHLQRIVPDCDLVVGTEEEIHIAGGSTDTLTALKAVRAISPALIVLKRGPMGCVAFPDAIPDDIEQGIKGPGFPVDVYNVLGAGDAFMSGFLRGWLRGEPIAECCRLANACGAFAVSRHGCAPAVPSWDELQTFLTHGSKTRRLREDEALNQLHWSTTRHGDWPEVCALAIDHRMQFEEMAAEAGASPDRIAEFKALAVAAARRAAGDDPAFGVLLDRRLGQDALDDITGTGCWVARPIETPGKTPLEFEGGPDVATTLREWPTTQIVKCLVFYHPDDPADLRQTQEEQLVQLAHAARATRHELLMEVVASKSAKGVDANTVPAVMDRLYALGIYPDWWKLETPAGGDAGWKAIETVIRAHDPYCRGVLVLGLDAPIDDLGRHLADAAGQPICKGFAVGRTVFQSAAREWLAGTIDDREAAHRIGDAYARLLGAWRGTQ